MLSYLNISYLPLKYFLIWTNNSWERNTLQSHDNSINISFVWYMCIFGMPNKFQFDPTFITIESNWSYYILIECIIYRWHITAPAFQIVVNLWYNCNICDCLCTISVYNKDKRSINYVEFVRSALLGYNSCSLWLFEIGSALAYNFFTSRVLKKYTLYGFWSRTFSSLSCVMIYSGAYSIVALLN